MFVYWLLKSNLLRLRRLIAASLSPMGGGVSVEFLVHRIHQNTFPGHAAVCGLVEEALCHCRISQILLADKHCIGIYG